MSLQPVEVIFRFDAAGRPTPLQVVQEGRAWAVEAIGRRWQDGDDEHILVMLPGERAVELIYSRAELRWFLRQPPQARGAPA